MGDGATVASQVCWNCKNGKRKCSKELPACARCSKLLLKCDYDYNMSDINPAGSKGVPSPASSVDSSVPPQLQLASRLMYALSEGSPRSAKLDAAIPMQVLSVLTSNGESIPSVTSTYFRTIDVWLPVIAAEPCMKRLETITPDNNVELSSLLLCMYLVTRSPGRSTNVREMQSPLYFEAKTLHGFLICSGRSSIEIIQAGLLMSLYEQGHGLTEAAQVTMTVCSRMASKMRVAQYRNSSASIQNTEFGRLWWGIVTLDRHLNQALAPDEINLVIGSSNDGIPAMELPTDDEVPAGLPALTQRKTNSGISASQKPMTRLGPFCRAAEAGHLLGRVLDLVAESAFTLRIDPEQSQILDMQLQQLAMKLMEFAVNGWEECCAAIGLCLSAMLLLHERTLSLASDRVGAEAQKQQAGLTLAASVRMIIDISRRFHMDLAFIDLPALPLPATYAVYRATMLYIQFSGDEFQQPEWISNMESLKGTLGHFGKRWNSGKHYLDLINAAITNEIESRAQNNRNDGGLGSQSRMKMEITYN